MARVSGEQRARAEMHVLYDKVLDRIEKIEDLLGAHNNKPKIALELENQMADLRANVLSAVGEA